MAWNMVQYLHLLDPGIPIDSGIPWEFNGESHTPFNKTTPLHGPKYIWLVVDLPLWKIMDFVSWDDDIPNIYIYMYGKIKNVPNHQPDMIWSSSNLWLILGVFYMNGARDCSTIVPQIILSIHHKSDKSVAKSRNLQFKLEVPSH